MSKQELDIIHNVTYNGKTGSVAVDKEAEIILDDIVWDNYIKKLIVATKDLYAIKHTKIYFKVILAHPSLGLPVGELVMEDRVDNIDFDEIILQHYHGFTKEDWEEKKHIFPYCEVPYIAKSCYQAAQQGFSEEDMRSIVYWALHEEWKPEENPRVQRQRITDYINSIRKPTKVILEDGKQTFIYA